VANVMTGISVSYDADAFVDALPGPIYTAPGKPQPNLSNVDPVVRFAHKSQVYEARYLNGESAVSALLMRSSLTADWIVEPALNAGTDLVIGLPTKSYLTSSCGVSAAAPFANRGFCATGAPEVYSVDFSDYEVRQSNSFLDFPQDPGNQFSFPWQTNVMTVNNTKILLSSLSKNTTLQGGIASQGALKVYFVNNLQYPAPRLLQSEANAKRNGQICGKLNLRGLPIHGFAVNKFANGNVGGILSNYGNAYALRYERQLTCE
jgi:hypothetical protein